MNIPLVLTSLQVVLDVGQVDILISAV